jgi:hypothetical protein
LKPVGQFASKESVNKAERNGKDESGSYTEPATGLLEKGKEGASGAGSGLAQGAQSLGNATIGNISSVKGVLLGSNK